MIYLNGFEGQAIYAQGPRDLFDPGHFVLVMPHYEELKLDERGGVLSSLSNRHHVPDPLQHRIQIPTPAIANIGLRCGPIHRHDQVIQP